MEGKANLNETIKTNNSKIVQLALISLNIL